MEDEVTDFDIFPQFLQHFNSISQNPTNDNLWTQATTFGLQWIVSRLESDAVPFAPDAPSYHHLFCDKGLRLAEVQSQHSKFKDDNLSRDEMAEIQTFLLFLISFKPKGPVQIWRETYETCIQNCLDCVIGHDVALTQLREKWLHIKYAVKPAMIDTFMNATYKHLIALCHSTLDRFSKSTSTQSPTSLSQPPTQVPFALLNLILSRPRLLTSPLIWQPVTQVLISKSDSGPIETAFTDLTLPGFILLTMSDNMDGAAFARRQLDHFAASQPAINSNSSSSEAIILAMSEILSILNRDHLQSASSTPRRLLIDLIPPPTRVDAWLSLTSIIQALPFNETLSSLPSAIQPSTFFHLPPLILKHLNDPGEHLESVYLCWGILMDRIGSSFWAAVQDTSSDSASFNSNSLNSPPRVLQSALAQEVFASRLASAEGAARCWRWLLPFVGSVLDSNEFSINIFAQLKRALVDDLQASRHDIMVHIRAADSIVKIWDILTKQLPLNPSSTHPIITTLPQSPRDQPDSYCIPRTRARQFMNIFLPFFLSLSYDSHTTPSRWAEVCATSDEILERLAHQEAQNIALALQELSQIRLEFDLSPIKSSSIDLSHLDIQFSKSLWTRLYKVANDHSPTNAFLAKACSLLIRSLSCCAHIDCLDNISWLPHGQPSNSYLEPTITALNITMKTIRAPLVDALMDLVDSTFGSKLVSMLFKQPSVIRAIAVLIFSPNDGIHTSALALVRQWSDCTSRLDCFRVLLSKGQTAAFEGLLISLKTTELYTKILPDAMRLARRFVRCMTDVLEVLCSRSDGLLRDGTFLQHVKDSNILQFWELMCSSVSNIFSRTPHWSKFWQTSEMTDWMRDALIFAEQLLEEFQTFETVTNNLYGASRVENVSRDTALQSQMVDSFMGPTESLLNWLRLTEPDLLDRSTRVLVQMLEKMGRFRRPLKSVIVDKLARYIERNTTEKPNASKATTAVVLTEQQCAYLQNALANHPDLAERFSTKVEETGAFKSKSSLDTALRGTEQKPSPGSWGNVFPSLKSPVERGGTSKLIEGNLTTIPAFNTKEAPNVSTKTSYSNSSAIPKFDSFRQQAKPTFVSKAPVKRSHFGPSNSVIGNLRKEFKASRQMINKPRPHVNRPIQPHDSRFTVERISLPSGLNLGKSSAISDVSANSTAGMASKEIEEESDEDSEGDEPEVTGLAALASAQKGQAFKSRKLAEPRRTIKRFDDPAFEKHQQIAQAKKQQQDRLRYEKLRMQPDFTSLHRFILQWDYNHTGPCPSNSPVHYDHLPSAYENFSHYLRSLEPLLLSECWQQICQAKEAVSAGEKSPIPCEVIGRTSVDDFVELCTTIQHGLLPDRMFFTEADLVLVKALSQDSSNICIMAKVISLQRKPEYFELNLKMHFGGVRNNISGHLVPKTKWHILHLCSLSTTHREWAALRSLPYLTLGDNVLDARANRPVQISDEQLSKVMRHQRVNEPQARAIISSLSTPGFSLIQGPPGTGKTSTIVGLIGAFMASRPRVANSGGGPSAVTRKVLLCAPSNAAVDEVVKRLKDGVRGAEGELIIPKLVRIGADSKVNLAVKDIFIDELVEAMSKEQAEPGQAAQTVSGSATLIHDLRQQITNLRETRDAKSMEAEQLPPASAQYQELQAEVTKIRRKIHELSQKIDDARDQQSASKRYLDAATKGLRMQILQDADVICSTLSGSGHDYMSQLPFDFETVVIDEACQCVEPASLIPLRYNATQCIMVGDPLQLPPTVLSQTATRAGYDQSLFVRMQKNNPGVVHLLSIQYRMHPEISVFPSKAFYNSRLLDGPEMVKKTTQPWHKPNSLFPPYAFYHPTGAREERGKHHSWMNRTEAALAVAIYSRLVNDYPQIDFAYRVGIITGYAAQVGEIRRQFRTKFPPETLTTIDINTVDGFQGQEKDIIILSCVRAEQEAGIGFLKDTRRMNVALTRAKSSLFIIGSQVALAQDANWKALIDDAAQRGIMSEASIETFSKFSLTSKPPRRSSVISHDDHGNKSGKNEPIALIAPKRPVGPPKPHNLMAAQAPGLKRKLSIPTSYSGEDVECYRPDRPAGLVIPRQDKRAENQEKKQKQQISVSPTKTRTTHSVAIPMELDMPQRGQTVNSQSRASREAGIGTGINPSQRFQTADSGSVDTSRGSSSIQVRPKPAVNMFIQKKRPPNRSENKDESKFDDTRSIKQRMQDEMGIRRKPSRF
ncbi:hypothetical protein O181_013331 [Austropuccinia psidii MF-1]|uniref:AAA+ ATPase domain-containing protein n=1 Tax=Austropuccinia psidii MF-1 TaxID=1389203 RepID=A0A9Q3BZH6_9BASI|nr:hypothetical protein [Austropuccinia psidii MF-1]